MFHRNKTLDLNLSDSNYAPAINPNTLSPQPATGARRSQPEPLDTPPKHKPQTDPSRRRIPSKHSSPTNSSKPPTIINNYYYVQPSPQIAPILPPNSPVMDPRYSFTSEINNTRPSPLKQQQQQQQQQQQIKPLSKPLNYASGGQRRTSQHTDYDKFVNSTVAKKFEGSQGSTGSHSPRRHHSTNHNTSIYDSASLISSGSGYTYKKSNEDLNVSQRIEPKVPNIELVESRKVQPINLIKILSKISDNDISVHNSQLYEIFNSFAKNDLIDFSSMRNLLCEPFEPAGRLPFSERSVEIIGDTFGSSNEINFRNFVKLSKFMKGCLVSFIYHDTKRSHMLKFDEFTKALKANAMVCPDDLLARIFEKSENLDFEGYIVGIVLIRSWERNRNV